MTRTISAIVTALLAVTVFSASNAEACVSCNYVPEVVNTDPKASAATPRKKGRVNKAVKQPAARQPKKQIAKPRPAPDKSDTVDTATKTVPVETQTGTEGSGVSTAALGEGEEKPADEANANGTNGEIGCKKFSPTAGTTINVPCE